MKKLVAAVSMLLLAACGGGGGGTSANVPAAQKTVIGTASQGAALTGTAYLKDAKGTETTSAIDSTGGFKFVVDNMTAPYILKAGALYSFASAPGAANINPFTDLSVKNASNVTDMAPVYSGSASTLATQLQTMQSKIQTVVDDLNTKIDQVYQKYGITTAAQKNFMTGSITIGQGVDAVFDTFKVSIATDGTITMKTKTGDAPIFTATRNSSTGIITITFDPNANANMPPSLVGTPVLTTAMFSGKNYMIGNSIYTFNANGTLSGTDANTWGTQIWTINSLGQLVITNTGKGTMTFTLISGDTITGWYGNVTYSNDSAATTGTFVPLTKFITAMFSGKNYMIGNSIYTFNANGTLSGTDANLHGNQTWTINASGQLVITNTGKGTATFTFVSGDVTSGWTGSVTYSDGSAATTSIFVPVTK
jgi:hypothetical protein